MKPNTPQRIMLALVSAASLSLAGCADSDASSIPANDLEETEKIDFCYDTNSVKGEDAFVAGIASVDSDFTSMQFSFVNANGDLVRVSTEIDGKNVPTGDIRHFENQDRSEDGEAFEGRIQIPRGAEKVSVKAASNAADIDSCTITFER